METIIVLCLLIVIALLLHDKIFKKNSKQKMAKEKFNLDTHMLGHPKSVINLSREKNFIETQIHEPTINPDSTNVESNQNNLQNRKEEQESVSNTQLDFNVEEEELKKQRISRSDHSLAQGITGEEFNAAKILLQKDKVYVAEQETSTALLQKIHGTELFNLLESSIEGASQKIAELLDSSFPPEADIHTSLFLKDDLNNFDIEEFI